MCDVAVPLPKCADCVATERAELEDKLLLTPWHPLIEARLKQLDEDELLRDAALAALDAERAVVARSGGVARELSKRQSELTVKRQEREMWAGRSRLLVASNDDLSTYPLDVVLSAWASHPSVKLRRRLAANSSVPAPVLEVLARDYDRDVLANVMLNPNRSWGCFFRVAANPHAVGGLAEVLCLLTAATLPPPETERAASDEALEALTVTEKFRLVRFLNG